MRPTRFMELYGYDLILALIAIAFSFFLGEVLKLGIIALIELYGLPSGSTAIEYVRMSLIPKIAFWIPPVVVTARLIQKSIRGMRRTPSSFTENEGNDEYRVW